MPNGKQKRARGRVKTGSGVVRVAAPGAKAGVVRTPKSAGVSKNAAAMRGSPPRARAGASPKLAAAGATADVVVPGLPDVRALRKAREARAKELLGLVEAGKARIAREFWLIGKALSELLRDKLYAALGHKSFRQMVEARRLMSMSTAKKLIAIAENVPANQALALGQEKAYELVRLTDWTKEDDTVAGLLSANASIEGRPVSEAKVSEVRVARQRLREERPRTPAERALAARRRKAEATLREFLIAHGVAAPAFERTGDAWNVRLSLAQIEALREP